MGTSGVRLLSFSCRSTSFTVAPLGMGVSRGDDEGEFLLAGPMPGLDGVLVGRREACPWALPAAPGPPLSAGERGGPLVTPDATRTGVTGMLLLEALEDTVDPDDVAGRWVVVVLDVPETPGPLTMGV
jgi:hypothetical protein